MERNKSAPVHFEGSQPILRVENMKLSLRLCRCPGLRERQLG